MCGVEAVGKLSKGKRYKVVLCDQGMIINEKLTSSEFVQFAEEDKRFLDEFQKLEKVNASGIEDCESSCGSRNLNNKLSSDVQIITTIQKPGSCEVLLPDKFNINDMVAADEKEQRVIDFLKNIEEGDFEHSEMQEIMEKFNRFEVCCYLICFHYLQLSLNNRYGLVPNLLVLLPILVLPNLILGESTLVPILRNKITRL